MKLQKKFCNTILRPWLCFTCILTGFALTAQVNKPSGSKTQATLADEQLLSIVKKHEALLGQYAEDPAKFEKRELSARVQSIVTAYTAFNNDNPADVFGFVLHGKFLREIGHYEDAYKLFIKAHELDPNIAIVKQQIGNYLAENGRYKEAYPYFVSAVRLDPRKAVYQYQLGAHLIYFGKQLQAGKMISAEEFDRQLSTSLAAAVRLAPENRTYKKLHAESFYDLNKPNWNEALNAWTKLLGEEASETETQAIQLHRAKVLYHLDRNQEANELLAIVKHPSLAASKNQLVSMMNRGVKETPSPRESTPAPSRPIATTNAPSAANQALKLEVEALKKELAQLKGKPAPTSLRPVAPAIPISTHNKALSELRQNLKQQDDEKKKMLQEAEETRRKVDTLENDLKKEVEEKKTILAELNKNKTALADLQKEISDSTSKSIPVVQHQKALREINQTLKDATLSNKRLDEELNTLKSQVKKTEAVKRKAANDLTQAYAERDAAKADLKNKDKEIQGFQKQFAREKENLQAQVNLLKKKSGEELQMMAANLQKSLSEERSRGLLLEKEKTKQTKEIQFLNDELANLEDKLLSMLDAKTKTERQQASTIKEYLGTIKDLKKEVLNKEKEQVGLVTTISSKEKDAQALRQKIQGLARQNQGQKETIEVMELLMDDLSSETMSIVAQTRALDEGELLSLRKSDEESRNKIAALQSELEKMRALELITKGKGKREKEETLALIQDLQKSLAVNETTISDLQKVVLLERTAKSKAENELQSAKGAAKKMQAEIDLENKKSSTLQQEIEQLQAINLATRKEASAANKMVAKKVEESHALGKQLEDMRASAGSGQTTITSLKKEIQEAKVSNSDLSKELLFAKDSLKGIQAVSEAMKKQVATQKVEQNKLQQQNTVLMEQSIVDANALKTLEVERNKLQQQNTILAEQAKAAKGDANALKAQINSMEITTRKAQQTHSNLAQNFRKQEELSATLADFTNFLFEELESFDLAPTFEGSDLQTKLDETAALAAKNATKAASLQRELDNAHSELNTTRGNVKKMEQNLSVQMSSSRAREALLQKNLEDSLAQKEKLARDLQATKTAESTLLKEIDGLKSSLGKRQTESVNQLKEIARLSKTVDSQETKIENTGPEIQVLNQRLKSTLAELDSKNDLLNKQEMESKKMAHVLTSTHEWIEILATDLEDSFQADSQNALQHAKKIKEIQGQLENQTRQIASDSKGTTATNAELEKTRTLLRFAQEKAKTQGESTLKAHQENQKLSGQVAQLQVAQRKNQKVVEALTGEISSLKGQSEKLLKELETKNEEFHAIMKQHASEEKAMQEKLKKSASELTEARTGMANRRRQETDAVAFLLDWNEALAADSLSEAGFSPLNANTIQGKDKHLKKQAEFIDTLEAWVGFLTEELTLENSRSLLQESAAQNENLKQAKAFSALKAQNKKIASQLTTLDSRLKEIQVSEVKPLQQQLFAEKENQKSLNIDLSKQKEEVEFLNAELKSLEDNLLNTLKKQSEDENKANRQIRDLKKKLAQAGETIDALKSEPSPSTVGSPTGQGRERELVKVYEKQLKEKQTDYQKLQRESSQEQDRIRKQYNALQAQMDKNLGEKKVLDELLKNQDREIVGLNDQLHKFKKELTKTSVPQNQRILDLEGKLKLALDKEQSLRNLIRELDGEKITLSEKLFLSDESLTRAQKQLDESESRFQHLGKIKPSQAIKKQLAMATLKLAEYKKDAESRIRKLTELEQELSKQRTSTKKEDHLPPEKEKLQKIIASGVQLQKALIEMRRELSKTRDEKNKALISLSEQNSEMTGVIKTLQDELETTRQQNPGNHTHPKQNHELLAKTLKRLKETENTIVMLQQNLAESNTRNSRLEVANSSMNEKLRNMQNIKAGRDQGDSASSTQNISQLKTALENTKAELSEREKQFEKVVARMNLILDRLHATPAIVAP